jgi:hypothetical protein
MSSLGSKFNDNLISKTYNTNTSHPLIQSSQEYMFYQKYISIHSEDRDIIKYPNSSEFEIMLPEDILNVSIIKLIQWTFPSNYEVFSLQNNNIFLAFKIKNPYNPSEHFVGDVFYNRIFEALFLTQEQNYIITIEPGFYNPEQMANELTNKFNYAVTQRLIEYFTSKGWNDSLATLQSTGGYRRFVIVYNNVSNKLWFGNRADNFIILNELGSIVSAATNELCINEIKHLPNSSNYGLSGYLGLPRVNTEGTNKPLINFTSYAVYQGINVPRFYYGDVLPGDEGYWLLPYIDLTGSNVYWVECVEKINLMGESFMYMELDGQNCIDETKPFNVSNFTATTNITNGVVDAAFAKIPIPTTPISQWFDRDSIPYKYYYPPAERIRKLKVKLRYHNGQPVFFGLFNFSFTLQFTIMVPQIVRESRSIVYPPPMGF